MIGALDLLLYYVRCFFVFHRRMDLPSGRWVCSRCGWGLPS